MVKLPGCRKACLYRRDDGAKLRIQYDCGENAYEQSKVISGKIKALIEAAGGTMADIVKVNIFLTEINDQQQVWEARREYFEFSVSTLLEVSKLVHPDMSVEIEAVGYLGAEEG